MICDSKNYDYKITLERRPRDARTTLVFPRTTPGEMPLIDQSTSCIFSNKLISIPVCPLHDGQDTSPSCILIHMVYHCPWLLFRCGAIISSTILASSLGIGFSLFHAISR